VRGALPACLERLLLHNATMHEHFSHQERSGELNGRRVKELLKRCAPDRLPPGYGEKGHTVASALTQLLRYKGDFSKWPDRFGFSAGEGVWFVGISDSGKPLPEKRVALPSSPAKLLEAYERYLAGGEEEAPKRSSEAESGKRSELSQQEEIALARRAGKAELAELRDLANAVHRFSDSDRKRRVLEMIDERAANILWETVRMTRRDLPATLQLAAYIARFPFRGGEKRREILFALARKPLQDASLEGLRTAHAKISRDESIGSAEKQAMYLVLDWQAESLFKHTIEAPGVTLAELPIILGDIRRFPFRSPDARGKALEHVDVAAADRFIQRIRTEWDPHAVRNIRAEVRGYPFAYEETRAFILANFPQAG